MPHTPTLSLRQVPLLRLLLPLLLGVILGWYWPLQTEMKIVGISLFVTALLLILLGVRKRTITEGMVWGIILHLWLLAFGWWRTTQHFQLLEPTHFSQIAAVDNTEQYWQGQVETVRYGEKSLRIRLAVEQTGRVGEQQPKNCSGKLLLYISTDERSTELLPGKDIQFRAVAEPLVSPLNPAAFDFAAWQARQNVFHRATVAPEEWQLVADELSVQGYAYLIRERLLSILRQYLPADSDELAVASALILGKKDALRSDLRNAYAETGAVHVLAVSGLHLGFIAWGLGLLFGWGPFQRRSWRWVRLACILTGIWIFALITGLPPSVQRAATMFSAVWIGIVLGRQSSIYNTLGASAMLLLLIDPYLLFDIGFQLSYLALLGIVFFQPRIYKLFYTRWWLLDKAWALVCVALAAQLTTFPLSLYYFHQFPMYFFLSGIVVVLAASLILGLGILLFLTAWFSPFASLIGMILYGVLWLNNAFIFQLQKLPGHLVSGIWIDEWQLVALLIAVFLIGVYVIKRRTAYLMSALAALLVVFGVNFWHQANLRQQKRLIVYHQYRATVIDAVAGRHRHTISSLEEDDSDLQWSIRPYREKIGVADQLGQDTLHWKASPPLYGFYDRRMVIINRDWIPPTIPAEPLVVDILLLQDAPNLTLEALAIHFEARVWVCDGSNYPAKVEQWQTEAAGLGIDLHWTKEKGAYILEF